MNINHLHIRTFTKTEKNKIKISHSKFLLFPLDVIEHDKRIQSYVSCPGMSQLWMPKSKG